MKPTCQTLQHLNCDLRGNEMKREFQEDRCRVVARLPYWYVW